MALRADASAHIGLGHVARSLALARALSEVGCAVRFVTGSVGVDTANLAAQAGIEHVALPGGADARGRLADPLPDANRTADLLETWGPDIVVVDHYGLDARWHRVVSDRLGARLAAIDDLADRDLLVDWLVDHNICTDHAAKYVGRVPASARILGGPRYALLATAYRSATPRAPRPDVNSIGIFMGGADAANASALALRACREAAGFAGPIELATTSANPNLASLRVLATRWPRTQLLVDAANLVEFFSRHDLHLGAGGGATWERCYLGAPTLAIVCADNQRAVIESLVGLGIAATPAPGGPPDVLAIGTAVRALLVDADRRREMSERGRALVDGFGARRVALCLAGRTLDTRDATLEDARTMFEWRNHPATRRMSSDEREITWDGHLRWLAATIADPRRALQIGQVGTLPVGVIRFDTVAKSTAEVSLYLDPGLHGLGLGGRMLRAAERRLAQRADPPRELVATVLASNESSRQMFHAAGYRPSGARWTKALELYAGDPQS